jgi:hypothetical protein
MFFNHKRNEDRNEKEKFRKCTNMYELEFFKGTHPMEYIKNSSLII